MPVASWWTGVARLFTGLGRLVARLSSGWCRHPDQVREKRDAVWCFVCVDCGRAVPMVSGRRPSLMLDPLDVEALRRSAFRRAALHPTPVGDPLIATALRLADSHVAEAPQPRIPGGGERP